MIYLATLAFYTMAASFLISMAAVLAIQVIGMRFTSTKTWKGKGQ